MKYWLILFRLPGGWDLSVRLLADDMVDAGNEASKSLKINHISICDIDRMCAEITELDLETGGRKTP